MISSPRKKYPWRRRLALLAVFITLLCALTLSRAPSVPLAPPPTATDALAMRAVFDRVRGLNSVVAPSPFSLTWSELRAASALGGRALSVPHLHVERANQMAIVNTSVRLPFAFWINASAMVERGEAGEAVIRGRLGHLPLPAPVMRGLIATVRIIFRWRGVDVPRVDDLVSNVIVTEAGVSAVLNVPRDSGLMQALGGLRPDPISAAAVNRHYCRIAALERALPEDDFAGQVRRAFAGTADAGTPDAGTPDEGRARLVALAMLTVSPEVGRLIADQAILTKGCLVVRTDALINARADLAKHWALSAALTASLGPDASLAMGVWKEMADSGQGGSGFSYADLAADRAGIMVAQGLADATRAPAMHRWLAGVRGTQLLPIQKLALAEGMSEAEFAARYDGVNSARDKAVVARIDSALQAALP